MRYRIGNSVPNLLQRKFGSLSVTKEIGWQDKKYLWECECTCGNIILVSHSKLVSGRVLGCGCPHQRYHDHSMRRKNWITSLRMTEKYKEFTKTVVERDGSTCVICRSSVAVCVHHIANVANHPRLATTITNGVCLCRSCHDDFHLRFMGGYAEPCDETDFEKWLSAMNITLKRGRYGYIYRRNS